MKDTRLTMGRKIESDCRQHGCVFGSLNECMYHDAAPHFIKTSYMDPEVAQEIVKRWYSFLPEIWEFPHTDTGLVDTVERAVCADVFRVNLVPADVLRELYISQDLVTRALHPKDGKKIADILLRIKNKSKFKLSFELRQQHLRLNLWPCERV
jgi:hypothetical protein